MPHGKFSESSRPESTEMDANNRICAAMQSSIHKLELYKDGLQVTINNLKIIGMGTAINHLEEAIVNVTQAKESLQRNINERMK